MSQKNTYEIACPQCASEQTVELYDAINVTEDPDLRGQLMSNQLNQVSCDDCDFSFRVDKSLLYHDAERHFMIYWIPTQEGSFEQGEQQFRESIGVMANMVPNDLEMPQVHLTFSRVELVERIFMIEAGLDERLIEYVKYLIYTKNMDEVRPSDKILLFNAQDSTDEALCFVIQNVESQQLEGMLQYSREAYNALNGMFDKDDQTPNLLEIFPGPYVSARAALNADVVFPEDGV